MVAEERGGSEGGRSGLEEGARGLKRVETGGRGERWLKRIVKKTLGGGENRRGVKKGEGV